MKVHDDARAAEVSGRISTHEIGTGEVYWDGVVSTPFGFVWCSTWATTNGRQRISLRAIIGGREYSQLQTRTLSEVVKTKRGLTSVAHRWIRELAATLKEGE